MSVPSWPVITKAKLTRRDGAGCWHCGDTETTTVQHRGVKGAGGRRSAERPSNGLLLCWAVNVALEQDAGLAEYGRAMGWKLSSHDDPAEVSAWDETSQTRWRLADDYTRQAVP